MNTLENKHHIMLDALAEAPTDARQNVRLCFELLSAAAAINRVCAARLARHNLSEGRFAILLTLQGAGGRLAPLELATRLAITSGTVTGLLDGLQGDGFIKRRKDAHDRRKLSISLTSAGIAVLDAVFAEHTDWIGTIMQSLDNAQRDALSATLQALSASPALALPPDKH
jgi:DNA-binding MarR family transcriptional regulator